VKRYLFLFCVSFLLWGCLEKRSPVAETDAPEATAPVAEAPTPKEPTSPLLTLDPEVTREQLDNGLTYYLRPNKKPENRLSLMLAVRAGSVNEDDDQQGLAHFLEHMAFNGTKNFEKMEIVNYLESIGMQFGPDINAYTSFDETVYMLDLPTDDPEIVEQGFRILSEWAHNIVLDPEEIDKERGVIIEEWRSRRGAGSRILDKQYPLYFKGSKYAERLPIGLVEVIETAPPEAFQRFYDDWYRPELMSIIAVGDYDQAKMKQMIETHFAPIKPNPDGPKREFDEVPDHEETLFSIESDPEMTSTSVQVIYKTDAKHMKTEADYRSSLISGLYEGMLNNRLSELRLEADPPFNWGFISSYNMVPKKRFINQRASVREGQWERGLEALMVELKRAQTHGFTATELARQKENTMRGLEKAMNEVDKTESRNFSRSYVSHFLFDSPVIGTPKQMELAKRFLPTITLEELNEKGKKLFPTTNRVITYAAPEKEGLELPTQDDFLALIARVDALEVAPYEDDVKDAPLLEQKPSPGSVVAEKVHENPAVTEWTLSNGARVILYPTQHKNDEILFSAQSPGGTSLAPLEMQVPASTATWLTSESGLGVFDSIQLDKKLTGKIASVSASISGRNEGMSGSASPQDLETFFKLIYLNFTAPRMEEKAVSSVKARIENFLRNRLSNPMAYFYDQYSRTYYQNHPWLQAWDESTLEKFDGPASLSFYKERFANAGDFTFFFVGNFEPEGIKEYVETYLASLPALERVDTPIDRGVRPVKGQEEMVVYRGLEPKSQVQIQMYGPAEWTTEERYAADALRRVLSIRLREVLREDKGGVYGVRSGVSISEWPEVQWNTSVSFSCSPDNVDSLIADVFNVMKELRDEEISDENLQKVKELQLRGYEESVQRNGVWLSRLSFIYEQDLPLQRLVDYPERVEKWLNKALIQKAAKKFLDEENRFIAKLFPEEQASGEGSDGEE
jgi:zinc protease